jgi:hypothetical protein
MSEHRARSTLTAYAEPESRCELVLADPRRPEAGWAWAPEAAPASADHQLSQMRSVGATFRRAPEKERNRHVPDQERRARERNDPRRRSRLPAGRPTRTPAPRMTAEAETEAIGRPRILLVPGSMRERSTNLAALRAAHDLGREEGSTALFTGLADLPLFSPDDDYEPLPESVVELRRQIARADGVLFSTLNTWERSQAASRTCSNGRSADPRWMGSPSHGSTSPRRVGGKVPKRRFGPFLVISALERRSRQVVACSYRESPSARTAGSRTGKSGRRSGMPYWSSPVS